MIFIRPEDDENWYTKQSPSEFINTLNTIPIPFRPAVLVTSRNDFVEILNLVGVKRKLAVDPETGDNCGTALLSIIYWIKYFKI